MSRAYTLTPRPKNLSTTATVIHRLRHPLRMRRVRHSSRVLSNPGTAPIGSDGRHSAAEDDWLEEPTSQGSPYELIEIRDRGECTEQRYGNVDLYWNSFKVGSSPDEKERRRVVEEDRRKGERNGRVFDNTRQLYQVFERSQPNHRSSTMPGQAISSLGRTSPNIWTGNAPRAATQLDFDASEARYITLTQNTSVAELDVQRVDSSRLTWNSAVTQILASPNVDSSVASEVKAQAGHTPNNQDQADEEVDMRAVSMVPNFSYPIANARWCDACHALDWPCLDCSECDNRAGSLPRLPNGRSEFSIDTSNDDVSFLELAKPNDADVDSLCREPAPTPASTSQGTSDAGSMLRIILEPEELLLYREVMSHNPRFTMLPERAENRQVSLVTKLSHLIEDLTMEIADLEGRETCRKTCRKTSASDVGYENLHIDNPVALVRAFDLMHRVLKGCWERECALLNTLLDAQDWRDKRRNTLSRLLTLRFDGGERVRPSSRRKSVVNRPSLGSMSSSSEIGMETCGDVDLSKRALDKLLQIAIQNFNILREDLVDVDRLFFESGPRTE